jgi:proteic killer suppression protein
MIVGFRDKRAERFAAGERAKDFPRFARQAEIRLDRLDAATSLADIAALPGNRFEPLKDDRMGQYFIRINDPWRICFFWRENELGLSDVEIVDHHR